MLTLQEEIVWLCSCTQLSTKNRSCWRTKNTCTHTQNSAYSSPVSLFLLFLPLSHQAKKRCCLLFVACCLLLAVCCLLFASFLCFCCSLAVNTPHQLPDNFMCIFPLPFCPFILSSHSRSTKPTNNNNTTQTHR